SGGLSCGVGAHPRFPRAAVGPAWKSRRTLLLGDIRLDDREALGAALGLKAAAISDAELLLAGFDAWGVELFPRLLGDFAIAIFQPEHRRLVLARDPL